MCAIGMWRLRYGAVLGFMALLAIVATALLAASLIEASNVCSGLVVALVVVGGAGYLFFKLVRVLSRIQMPQRRREVALEPSLRPGPTACSR